MDTGVWLDVYERAGKGITMHIWELSLENCDEAFRGLLIPISTSLSFSGANLDGRMDSETIAGRALTATFVYLSQQVIETKAIVYSMELGRLLS